MTRVFPRYGDVAVLFHWLIAIVIIALLAIGKYMTSLDDNDPVRFALTQWHKSFGLTILFLSVLRLLWRFTHSPPPELDSIAYWQQKAASAAHIALYAMMFILPVTGWIMVSASPLNIDTILFDVIPIPHLPPFADLPNKAEIAESFHEYHEIASGILIVILLAHIGAALKHHFIDKDAVMIRMLPSWSSTSFKRKLAGLMAVMIAATAALAISANSDREAAMLAAGDSAVSFIADVTGEQTPGSFTQSRVTASIDQTNPANSTLTAIVQTATVQSDNAQVEGSLTTDEWFDPEGFPEATFESTTVSANDDGSLQVDGNLTIKEITQPVSFALTIGSDENMSAENAQVATGEFVIDRRDFNVGMESQATDEYVGFSVSVRFRFDIGSTPNS